MAVQVMPERRREATCKLLSYHGEGQKRVATVRTSVGRGRGRCGLSADSGRPCPEVPRSVAVSGDAPSIRGDCHDSYICCVVAESGWASQIAFLLDHLGFRIIKSTFWFTSCAAVFLSKRRLPPVIFRKLHILCGDIGIPTAVPLFLFFYF